MNNDLKKILQKLENRGGNNGINITFDENGIKGVRGNDGYTPVKGQDYFTEQEIRQIIEVVRQQATPVKGKDYWTAQEVADIIKYIQSNVKDGENGKDGRDGRDGVDGETPDTRAVAIDAVTLLESFEGDARLSATALRDFEVALDEALKNPDFKISLSADQISGIQDLLPKYPPMNAGGSGATFLKSLRDVDLSALTKNADGKYVLGGGSGSLPDQTGNSGKFLTTDGTDASWATLAGGGDMAAATYDPATIAEQLVGLTATQTLTNKTLTQPTITLKQGTAPTPTAEGDIQWDTDDNKIKIGDGASTKTFSDDSVNAATYQPLDSDLTTIAAANNGSVLAATTASFTTADETKLDGIETGADVTDTTNVSAAGAPIISSGAGAPASTPSKVGDIYIDTTNDDAYIAVGTASSADWEKSNDGAGGGTGDVVGPASATNNAIARFDTTTGKLIQDSSLLISDTGTLQNLDAVSTTSQKIFTVLADDGTTVLFNVDGDRIGAVNYVEYLNATTGNNPAIQAWGSDTNIGLTLTPKGSGSVFLNGATRIASLTGVLRADTGVVSVDSDVTDIVSAASDTAAGKVELATTAETNTGTDTTRAVTPDGLAGSYAGAKTVAIMLTEPATDCTTGNGKAYFIVPAEMAGMNLIDVKSGLATAGTTGTHTLMVHNVTQAVDMLSTALTIDSTETTSETAATPAVIDTANDDVAEGDVIRIDCDAVQTTAGKGDFITLVFKLP